MIPTYLVCYDIEDNRWRKKLADKLLSLGLERIQYSVFAGPMADNLMGSLQEWVNQNQSNLLTNGNSVIFLTLLSSQLEKMTIFGEVKFDPIMLAGKRNTLIL